MDRIIYYLASLVAVILVFSPHEFAHAYVAYKNGDPTAKFNGRMTLNPLKHLDPAGFVLCAVAGFGWAKPVPINPSNFHNYKKGLFLTAVAGVIANYIVAFIAYLIYVLLLKAFSMMPLNTQFTLVIEDFIVTAIYLTFAYSLYSVVFNLLPLNPLDGFREVEALSREVNPVQRFLRDYGQMILILLIAESFICSIVAEYYAPAQYFNILGYVGWLAREILGYPIQAAWNWILKL